MDENDSLVYRQDSLEDQIDLSKFRAIQNSISRFLLSKAYTLFYAFMILLNFALILWIIINASVNKKLSAPSHWLFAILEVLINLTFLIEILLHIISQKKSYFKSWSNLFDLSVLFLSFIGLVIYFIASSSVLEEADDLILVSILLIRYLVQFLRLISMIKNPLVRRKRQFNNVDFSHLSKVDDPFVISDDSQDNRYGERW